MSSAAELEQALSQSNKQLGALTEIVKNKSTYDKKGGILEGVVNENNEFSQPTTPYDTKYPYNNATVTESGHTFEMDDTPGAERVSLSHRTGTFFEVHPDGSKTEKIMNDNVQIILKDNQIYIMGNENKSTQGNLKLYIKGNVKAQVDGEVELEIVGNLVMKVGGDVVAQAKSFNFVGDINHVGDFKSTGNILNQGNISSAKNIQAQQDFVGLRDFALTRNATIGGYETVVGKITGADVTTSGVSSLNSHVHLNGGGVGNSGTPAG
jgi:hypothetical protein